MILRTLPSQAGWMGETTVSSLVLLTYDPTLRPNLLPGQCRFPRYLGMLCWSQRPSLICSEVPAIFRDLHCRLAPGSLISKTQASSVDKSVCPFI